MQTFTDHGQELTGVIYFSERCSVLCAVVNVHTGQARKQNVIL